MMLVNTFSAFAIIIIVSAQSSINLETKTPLITKEGGKALKRCTDNVVSSLVVPKDLRFDYNNNNSAKTLENLDPVYDDPLYAFSLVTEEPNCMSGTFNVTVFLTNNGTSSRDVGAEKEYLSFTVEGALSYWVEISKRIKHIIYHRENYCISSITEELISFKLCKSQCFAHDGEAGEHLCVSRCCPPGKISSVQGYKIQGCIPSNGTDWCPEIYEYGNSTTADPQIYPQIIVNDNPVWEEWNCTKDEQVEGLLPKSGIRFLPDGRILLEEKHTWSVTWGDLISEKEPVPYCIDGLKDPGNPQTENAMLVLKKCLSPSDIREKEGILKNNEETLLALRLIIFLVYLPSTVAYLVIIIVYLSIWDKHHAHGWVVLGFSASQFVNFLFHTIVCFLIAFTSDFKSIFTPQNPSCFLFGIFQTFFHIFQYSWAVVITFDLWNTLSSCKMESGQSKWKRIVQYFSFAAGFPAFVVFGVAVPMEFLAEGGNVIIPGYRQQCIVNLGIPYFLYISTPNIILYITNLVFAGLTFRTLRVAKNNAMKMTTSKRKDTLGNQAALLAKLLFVMGFSLIVGFVVKFAALVQYSPFYGLLDGFSLLQAIGLFWTFVCGKKTQKHLRERFPSVYQGSKRNGSTSESMSEGVRTDVTLSPVSEMSHETNP